MTEFPLLLIGLFELLVLVSLSLFVLVTGVWFAVFVFVIVGLFVFVVVVVTSVDAAESTNLIENIKHKYLFLSLKSRENERLTCNRRG